MIVGLICARKGSEGLPGKNFATFAGRPLIEWSIEQALASERLDAVAVLTDASYEHPDTIRLYEPSSLARGDVAKWQVWQWAAAELESHMHTVLAIVDIDVTRPLRDASDIDHVIKRYLAPPPTSHVVMGVAEAKWSPYFDILENGPRLRISKPVGRFTVRQNYPTCYNHAGVYCVHRRSLISQNALFEPGQIVAGVKLPRLNALDIDDELDWQIAEHLMERKILQKYNIEAADRVAL